MFVGSEQDGSRSLLEPRKQSPHLIVRRYQRPPSSVLVRRHVKNSPKMFVQGYLAAEANRLSDLAYAPGSISEELFCSIDATNDQISMYGVRAVALEAAFEVGSITSDTAGHPLDCPVGPEIGLK